MHSNFSSGGRTVSEMAEIAQKQNVKVIILTDLYAEHYEYGIGPLRKFFKKTFERTSILKRGTREYLHAIEEAGRLHPGVLVIDGTAVTPFYYWSGGLWPGPLVLNNRAKDLLVLGLGSEENYKDLPVIGNKKSKFDPYAGDAYSKPYQEFIDHVKSKKALVFWSHPQANEHIFFNNAFFGLDVYIDTPHYEEALLSTFRYDGFGIFPTDLSLIHLPGHASASSPGQTWDRVLLEYCEGKRTQPIWAIGESDYNGFPDGIRDMDGILNMILARRPERSEILQALKSGSLYVITPASHTERIMLDEFSVSDEASGNAAGMGQTLPVSGLPLIRLRAHLSEDADRNLEILLIRDQQVIAQWKETLPFDIRFQDRNAKQGKSYYRIIAYSSDSPHRLITNPIFTERR